MPSIAQFMPLPAYLRLLRKYKPDAKYRKRARSRIYFGAAVEPLRWYELIRHGRRIRNTELNGPPVFLLGFGRSGTTHLHNLMWQDPQFGVITNYQANMHPIALTGRGWIPRMLEGRMPSTRPMDNVRITLDSPQEEEIAVVNATDDAPFHFMSFPRALPEMYDRYVTDLGTDTRATAGWKRAYIEVLRKATILSGGKRLLLKTPPNTGRVGQLLEMFPDAPFVHIVRNPYSVYQSMRNMYRKVLPGNVLQEIDWDAIDAWIIHAYRLLMTKYLEERKRITPNRLVEIRYEDFDADPVGILRQIYDTLELGDFETVRPRFVSYLEGLGTYEKNVFEFPAEIMETVNKSWGFAFDAFGYERISPATAPQQTSP
jgi:hypothetical protein